MRIFKRVNQPTSWLGIGLLVQAVGNLFGLDGQIVDMATTAASGAADAAAAGAGFVVAVVTGVAAAVGIAKDDRSGD